MNTATVRLSAICSVIFVLICWADYPLMQFISEHYSGSVRGFFWWVGRIGTDGFWIAATVVAFLAASIARSRDAKKISWTLALARPAALAGGLLLSGAVVRVLKLIVGRFRPNEVLRGADYCCQMLAYKGEGASFPSGHAGVIWAGLGWAMLVFPRARLPLAIIGLVGTFARVVMLRHFVSDIFAGAMIGAYSAVLVYGAICKGRSSNDSAA